ncbi:hypothetical protein TVAG_261230 [Trichomonas vaginalis G3]|uniref:Uncharacterized protein n=1 Tax=Trichomonas vaginalis (strain ATCC PRA-98 / G3) TaxID=412133 RepID=A2G184_TRIV3|nr:Ankyrin repeat family [Trichomonas vaginalis G3]EAX89078.1 hypothetical protein TVAG_261230 [Trichomonas vaginalis G3]KAI5521073.1 Ankyrin repeat family [Trichomonas vaginalis G3]|eukprot:XP_001302008.1 hypothetical protein [Trichomonas vaginalis G3]
MSDEFVEFDIEKLQQFATSQKIIDDAPNVDLSITANELFDVYHEKLDLRCLIRDIIYFGCIRPKYVKLYVSLLQEMLAKQWNDHEKTIIQNSLKYKHHCLLNDFAIECQNSSFLIEISSRKIIQPISFRNLSGQSENLWKILVDDDIEALIELSAVPNFDLNFEFIYDGIKRRSFLNVSALLSAVKCFRFLIGNNIKVDESTIHCAVSSGSSEMIRLVEQNGGVIENCISDAIVNYRYDIARWLSDRENNIDEIKQICMESGNIVTYLEMSEALEMPIDGSPFDVQFPTVHFIEATKNCDLFLSKILTGMTLHKDVDRLDMCCEKGVNIDTFIDAENQTIFSCFAASGGSIFEHIAELGANPNIPDIFNYTTLNCAIEGRNLNSVKYLIEKCNASIKIPNDPLSHAACIGSYDTVKYLLGIDGIDVNKISEDRMTPLLIAAERNHIMIVELLLSHPNVDKEAKNEFGKGYSDFLVPRTK